VSEDTELLGEAAPPLANGELLFDAPWQSRVFGMARVLCEAGLVEWDEFRQLLIRKIGDWEASHVNDDYPYYEIFLDALLELMQQGGVCAQDEILQREAVLARRPHGHDH